MTAIHVQPVQDEPLVTYHPERASWFAPRSSPSLKFRPSRSGGQPERAARKWSPTLRRARPLGVPPHGGLPRCSGAPGDRRRLDRRDAFGDGRAISERHETASTSLVNGALSASARVVATAAKATRGATEATGKIIDEARERFQKEVGSGVADAMESVAHGTGPVARPRRGQGDGRNQGHRRKGDHREPRRLAAQPRATLTEVSKTLDVNNPASPLGALERRLAEQQQAAHGAHVEARHRPSDGRGSSVGGDRGGCCRVARVNSPAKGRLIPRGDRRRARNRRASIGAAYLDTADSVGRIKSCKKGDGILDKQLPDRDGRRDCPSGGRGDGPRSSPQLARVSRNSAAQPGGSGFPRSCAVGRLGAGGGADARGRPSAPASCSPSTQDRTTPHSSGLRSSCFWSRRSVGSQTTEQADVLSLADSRLEEARRRLVQMGDIIKTAVAVRNGWAQVVTGLEALHQGLLLDDRPGALSASGPHSWRPVAHQSARAVGGRHRPGPRQRSGQSPGYGSTDARSLCGIGLKRATRCTFPLWFEVRTESFAMAGSQSEVAKVLILFAPYAESGPKRGPARPTLVARNPPGGSCHERPAAVTVWSRDARSDPLADTAAHRRPET